jgi:hypothetical protein
LSGSIEISGEKPADLLDQSHPMIHKKSIEIQEQHASADFTEQHE